MARYNQAGLRVATTVFEAAAWHRAVKLTCPRCGHSATYNAHCLWWRLRKAGKDDSFAVLRQRYFCRRCRDADGQKVRPRIETTTLTIDAITGDWPDEREWKRALSRFRS